MILKAQDSADLGSVVRKDKEAHEPVPTYEYKNGSLSRSNVTC